MNFGEAISSGFSNYVNFSGRAARSEYWFWLLFTIIVEIVTGIVDALLGITLVTTLFLLVTLLPNVAVGVRRLHDTDRTGWWLLLVFIPLIGAIILIVWFCTMGTRGYNRFGPDPLGVGVITRRPAA